MGTLATQLIFLREEVGSRGAESRERQGTSGGTETLLAGVQAALVSEKLAYVGIKYK
jgi:hypothetical protein